MNKIIQLFHLKFKTIIIRGGQKKTTIYVLGVGRSGTTWISNVLASSEQKITFFEEPLFHFRPRIILNKLDRVSCGDKDILSSKIIKYTYSIIKKTTSPNNFFYKKDIIKKQADNSTHIIIKEVHSLLALKEIFSHDEKYIIILRHPLSILDSIFTLHTLRSTYLEQEFYYLTENNLLGGLLDANQNHLYAKLKSGGLDDRLAIISKKILTIQAIQNYLINFKNNSNVRILHYEEIVKSPFRIFRNLFEFCDLEFSKVCHKFLNNTTKAKNNRFDPHDIRRNTSLKINPDYKFFSKQEINYLQEYGF
jgi:hypothetical protein